MIAVTVNASASQYHCTILSLSLYTKCGGSIHLFILFRHYDFLFGCNLFIFKYKKVLVVLQFASLCPHVYLYYIGDVRIV